jgi:hypothetical protein
VHERLLSPAAAARHGQHDVRLVWLLLLLDLNTANLLHDAWPQRARLNRVHL